MNTLSDNERRTESIRSNSEDIHRLYFKEGLSMKTIAKRYGYKTSGPISRIFRMYGWIPRPVAKKQISINPDKIWKLYFEDGLSQGEIAKRFGFTSKTPIRRIFLEEGWEPRHRWRNIDSNVVYEMYFKKKFSLKKVADKLGLNSVYQVICVLEAHGWTPRSSNTPRKIINPKDVYRLYFDKKFTMIEIARKFGYSTCGPIARIFKKYGWNARRSVVLDGIDFKSIYELYFNEKLSLSEIGRRLGLTRYTLLKSFKKKGWKTRKIEYDTENERQLAKKEAWIRHRKKVIALRDYLFGVKCIICGDSKEIIHRKDGKKHDNRPLWSLKALTTINPNDWVALCKACHLNVHALMRVKIFEWEDILSLLKR